MGRYTTEMSELIWSEYLKTNQFGVPDLEQLVDVALSLFPELTYSDCCEIALKYFGVRGDVIPFCPEALKWCGNALIKKVNPKSILVPFADGSEYSLLSEIKDVDYHFYNNKLKELAKKYCGIYSVSPEQMKNEYSLIIADLPLAIGNKSAQIVEACSDLLSEEGYALFTFSKTVTMGRGLKWLQGLKSKGIYCNAILDMPINSYGFLVQVETVIVILSKKKTERLFVASITDESIASEAIENFLMQRQSNTKPQLGIYVNDGVYSFSDYNTLYKIQNKSKSLGKNYNGPLMKISQLGEVFAPDRHNEFNDNSTSVYIPKLGKSPVVTCVEEFHIKAQNYFQVVLDENRILPRYLSFFLNSEEGRNLRTLYYKGAYIKCLNKELVGNIEVPCPSIETQAEYLSTLSELEILQSQVDSLKDKFQKIPAAFKTIRNEMKDINNHGDKFVQWIETLPYPIATILKKYSVSDDLSKQQESLFYFFEAYSIFEAAILSGVLNKQIVDCSSLKEVDSSFFEKASFGNWVRMDRALSGLYIKLLNSDKENAKNKVFSCFQSEDEQLINLLCNTKVCNVLEQASNKRNLWKGHPGISNEIIYKEHVDILDGYLREIQKNLRDLFERLRLVRPIGLEYIDERFENKVEVLTGSNPIFPKEVIISNKPMDKTKLYIQMMDTGEVVELPPYFILKNSPAEVKNACYFYSRIEDGNTRYVSYHFEGKPEDTESGSKVFDSIVELFTF